MDIDGRTYRSPNYSGRNGRAISMLVIHATVGGAQSSLAWLCNPASRVSTHYLITKQGKIYQLVDDDHAAWHAGASRWLDLDSAVIQACSLGIELENANTGHDPYPPAQVEALTWLAQVKIAAYGIAPAMLVRHLDIAIPAGRKTDPAGFDWAFWKASVTHPIDPLRTNTLAGPAGAFFCSKQVFTFYSTRGGFPLFGYALGNETRDGDATWLRCERAVIKTSAQYGVELALLSEARARGWA